MSKEIDITKIALSREEMKQLRKIRKLGVISALEDKPGSVVSRLYSRALIEKTYSRKFPLPELVDGFVTIPCNAFKVSDAGAQYLNMIWDRDSERFKTRVIAVWGAVTGTLSLLLHIAQQFR